jgi:hypothetical protein
MAGFRTFALALVVATLGLPPATAGERDPNRRGAAQELDLFEGLQSGEVAVRFIPRDAASGTVLITNLTMRPLAIRLPAAFAGIPVLAQVGPGNGRNGANNANNAGNQSVGGAFPGIGQGNGAPGLFNIDAGRARKLKTVSVCLEHGKPEPAPRVPYELAPLARYTTDRAVIEVVNKLGQGQIDQPAAQAAAWHLTDRIGWQELASQTRIEHLDGTSEPMFTAAQLDRARQLVESAVRLAAQPATASPGGE